MHCSDVTTISGALDEGGHEMDSKQSSTPAARVLLAVWGRTIDSNQVMNLGKSKTEKNGYKIANNEEEIENCLPMII